MVGVVKVGVRTFKRWNDDEAGTQAAALAYYSVFSIAPMLVIAIAIAGAIFGADAASGQIKTQLTSLLGDAAAGAIESLLASAHRGGNSGLAAVIGSVALLLGAIGVFTQLQQALNMIWRAPPAAAWMGLKGFIRKRLLSMAMVIGIGFLLLISLLLSTVVSALGGYVSRFFPGWDTVLNVINLAVTLAATAALFTSMFVYLPDQHVKWRHCWLAGLLTAVLFTVGKVAIGLYLGHSAVTSSFGAAGSLAIVLIWVYYTAQLVLFGAELSWVMANPERPENQPITGGAPGYGSQPKSTPQV